jgi:hypothetical protein
MRSDQTLLLITGPPKATRFKPRLIIIDKARWARSTAADGGWGGSGLP